MNVTDTLYHALVCWTIAFATMAGLVVLAVELF